jgi:hypothetical protein
MMPVGLTYRAKKGWQIIHQCKKCRAVSINKVATDTVQPDDYRAMAEVALPVMLAG